MPAHLTILYPFVPAGALDSNVVEQLGDVFGSIEVFEIALTSIGWFDL